MVPGAEKMVVMVGEGQKIVIFLTAAARKAWAVFGRLSLQPQPVSSKASLAW